jgi:hypothetical protein
LAPGEQGRKKAKTKKITWTFELPGHIAWITLEASGSLYPAGGNCALTGKIVRVGAGQQAVLVRLQADSRISIVAAVAGGGNFRMLKGNANVVSKYI